MASASGWKRPSLAEHATITLGGTPSTEVAAFWDGNVPWMASGDVHLRIVDDVPGRITQLGLRLSNATLVDPPAVAIALAGQGKTRGTVAFVRVPLSSNQSIALLKGVGALDTKYLFYDLDRRYEELRARSSGGGRGGLSRRVLAQIPVELPPLPEQGQIVAILDTIYDAIRGTEQIIAKLKQVKQGLLHDLLTRGIDENGELRDPERHPERFKDSSRGRIPTAWRVSTVEGMCSDVVDCPHSTPRYLSHGIPCIRTADMIPGHLLLAQAYCVDEATYRNRTTRLVLREGDIIYSREGERLAIASSVGKEKLCLGQRVMAVRPRADTDPHFLVWAMNAPAFYRQATMRIGATTSPHINVDDVRRFLLPAPPSAEQKVIGDIFRSHASRIHREERTVEKLSLLKRGLLEDLLTGRVRVTRLLENAAE